jgi:hypothetical protein
MITKLDFKVLGFKKLSDTVKHMNKLNKSLTNMKDKLSDNKDAFAGLADSKITRFFDKLNHKMLDIHSRNKNLEEVGGTFGFITAKIGESYAMLGGLKDVTIVAKLKLIAGAFTSMFLPLVAGIAVLYVFKKLWEENIGGVQTKWIAFTGRLMQTWNNFDVQFRQTLRTLGPMFGKFFSASFAVLEGVFSATLSVINGLTYVLGPMFEMLGSIFGLSNEGKSNTKMWKILGQVIAGVVVAVTALYLLSNPFGWAVIAITTLGLLYKKFALVRTIVDFLVMGFKFLLKYSPIGVLVRGTGFLIDNFAAVWNWVKKIFSFAWENTTLGKGFKLFQKAKGFLGGGDKEEESSVDSASSKSYNMGKNQQNINDSRSSTVNINTQKLDEGNANAITNMFINPVVQAGKY